MARLGAGESRIGTLILILSCLALGKALSFSPRFPKSTAQTLNAVVIWVSFPAVVLLQILALLATARPEAAWLIPASMAWIQFGLALLVFVAVGKWLRWERRVVGALVLTAGLSNTSFVGLPLLEAMHGQAGVQIGVLVDQLGSFPTLSILGLLVAGRFSGSPEEGSWVRRVFGFPPFLAFLVAVAWHFAGIPMPGALREGLEKVGATLLPLALLSVGFQLKISPAALQRRWKPLACGLGFKLILAPLFFLALYVHVLGSRTFSTQITILQAAMAPMITAAIVAEEFGLNAELANLMVGIGIPLSLLTVSLWGWLI